MFSDKNKNQQPGKLRSLFWPIYGGEYKKFLMMMAIFFLIAFNYNLLRAAKDTLIITAPASGAETIPFIKVWAMLPSAVIMTFFFTRLADRLSREKVIYSVISFFLGFFALFTFFLYPLKDYLHPHGFADYLSSILPLGFKGFIAIFRNWTLTTYYVMSELWGTMVLTILFWGFANDVISVPEAKRFYPLFGVGANISGMISGQVAILLSSMSYHAFIPIAKDNWDQALLLMNITVILIGFVIMGLFRHIQKGIVSPSSSSQSFIARAKKPKISLKENFKFLAQSRYLICITIIVISYFAALNLIEVLWKNQVKLLYPNPIDYNIYMGQVMTLMGFIATIIAIFITGNVLRRFSWTFNALITPLIMVTTTIGFLITFFLKDSFSLKLATLFGTTPLALCVLLGTIQNCMSRATKYTLFDATKEIAFIPLDSQHKLKGKAAIDGVASRFGKSGGSVIHQSLLIIFATLSASTPYVSIIFFMLIFAWVVAVRSLGKQFVDLLKKKESLEKEEEPVIEEEELVLSGEAASK